MSKGDVKNSQTDQRVGNKSGHQGRNRQDQSASSDRSDSQRDRE